MDAALTDAGFGLQFADVCTDSSMAGNGEKPTLPRAGDVATEKNPARNAGTAGTVAPAGNTVHAGNVVRPFPGTAADGGMKKAPVPGTQTFGTRQPVQTATMPHGQAAPAGVGQPVRTAAMPQNQGGQLAGIRQPVHAAAMSQNQGRQQAGTGQPIHTAAIPQNQGRQPVGTRQSAQTAAIPQGQTTPPAGARQPVQAAMPQGQKVQPATVPQGKVSSTAGTGQPISVAAPQGQSTQPVGARQSIPPVMAQKHETLPAGSGQSVMPQSQGVPSAGNQLPVSPAKPQKRETQPVGSGQSVMPQSQEVPPAENQLPVSPTMPQKQDALPAGTGQPAQSIMPQGQGVLPAENQLPVSPAMPQKHETEPAESRLPVQTVMPQEKGAQPAATAAPVFAASRESVAGGYRSGEAVKGSTASGEQAVAPNPATEQGKAASSAGAVDTARPAKGQRYFGNTKAVTTGQQSQPPHQPAAARPAAPQEQPGQLPVPPASPENKGTVQSAADTASGSMDSLPVPPMGKSGQTNAEPAAVADALPVPAGSPGKDKSRSSVLEAIALLNGQAPPAGTAESPAGESKGSIDGSVIGNEAAASMEAASPEGALPVNGETAQGEPVPRYTPDMPVEEIISLMTLEEAGKVVVDTGVSKGQTIAEVAERRPPSLKFYRYGGYKGPNNILRAAAQIMLDSMEGQKAS